jgi:hypothetical protein
MTKSIANECEARELAIYATNNGPLRFGMIDSVLNNLARKLQKGTYDSTLALKAWASVAGIAAKEYAKEFCGPDFDYRQFSKATRELAAKEIAEYYEDSLRELVEDIARDAKNKRDWPISAIAEANKSAGLFFFSRDTLRFFGDKISSFGVLCQGGKIYVFRKTAPKNAPTGYKWNSELREFNPATGEIGAPIRESLA